jgi:RNA polymerase I-specific transcription initiation factor RRN11
MLPDSYLADPATVAHSLDSNLLREAQAHFERAQALDPANAVAAALLNKLPSISQGRINTSAVSADHDSDEDDMDVGDSPHVPRKRIRT